MSDTLINRNLLNQVLRQKYLDKTKCPGKYTNQEQLNKGPNLARHIAESLETNNINTIIENVALNH